MRNVHVATFNGPLELLLSLIEQEQLDITQIALAQVTEQYISELQKMTELPIEELADFLVVAAKLLYIKSRAMVPSQTLPDDDVGLELERQLKMYRAFVEAAKQVAKLWNRHKVSYARDGYAQFEPIFNPPEKISRTDLADLWRSVLHQLEPVLQLPQTVIIRTINIREKIRQIYEYVLVQKQTDFHALLKKAKNRTEIIITFLALLELVKQRNIDLDQDRQTGNMAVAVSADQPAEISMVNKL